MNIREAKTIVQTVPHSASCARGSADIYAAVYGKSDPDCPHCKAMEVARNHVAARMF